MSSREDLEIVTKALGGKVVVTTTRGWWSATCLGYTAKARDEGAAIEALLPKLRPILNGKLARWESERVDAERRLNQAAARVAVLREAKKVFGE